MRKQGITFLEVLVVIGILSLLAGILFLNSAPTRENARQTNCVSNLKQVYPALTLYRADYPDGPAIPGSEVPILYTSPPHQPIFHRA